MQLLKKLTILLFIVLSNITIALAAKSPVIKEGLLNNKDKLILEGANAEWSGNTSLLDYVFIFIKDSLTSLLLVAVVGVFLYIGIKLVLARGNPEEFKKALMHFVYVAVGMFVVSVAYAAVKLVAGINF